MLERKVVTEEILDRNW